MSDPNQAEDCIQERTAKLLCGGFRENRPEVFPDLHEALGDPTRRC